MDGEGESIDDWLERLELVAATCHWEEQAKLVNVAARLRGSASRFYRCCTPQQRSSYVGLTTALCERFTPVRLQSVQSSKFHERRQLISECVDDYAQELRKLFYRAYSTAQDAGSGAEAMGRSVLAYQFVAGLRDKLKAKLVGQSGSFEELLCKARFEEARMREMEAKGKGGVTPLKARHTYTPLEPGRQGQPPANNMASGVKNKHPGQEDLTCYSCGGVGHFRRDCPLKGRGQPIESPGGERGKPKRGPFRNSRTVSMVRPEVTPEQAEPSQVVDAAVEQVMATMHGIETLPVQGTVTLGPVLRSVVGLDSKPVHALIDTGSPVSIVSLEFYLKTAAERRQAQHEWARDVCEKLQPTTVSLRNYGGDKLAIVSQVKCQLTSDREAIETVVQVQKGAAEDLLLGTDVLSRLGFSLVYTPKNGHPKDLLQGGGEQPSTKHRSTRTECEANSLLQLPAEDGDASPPVVSAPPNTTATVRLIHAARIPAQHYKLVHVTIDSPKTRIGHLLV